MTYPSIPVVQVETLRKQDTSLQLSRTREELSESLEKTRELEGQLGQSKNREDTLRSQLREVEQKWKEVSSQAHSQTLVRGVTYYFYTVSIDSMFVY